MENPPARLDKALSRDVPEGQGLSRSRLSALIKSGAVSKGAIPVCELRARVAEGEVYDITVPVVEESHITPEDIPLDIIYEDDDLIVVNKPVGMVVHPAPGTPSGTLVNALLGHFGTGLSAVGGATRPGIVHRIDKDTSGLLVVAKNDAAHQSLAAQFAAHTVHREYLALVNGQPDQGDPRLNGIKGVSFEPGNILRLTTQLARHKTDRQRQAVLFQGGRHAITRARRIDSYGNPAQVSLVMCWLETGRTHQIRVHMAHAGHGLVGDQTYGGRRKLSPKAISQAAVDAARAFPRQALHAASLGFIHPVTGKEIRFQADLPEDMQTLIATLKGGKDLAK